MRLIWTTHAKQELKAIVTYIWHDNPSAARRMRNRIETSAAYLKSQPFASRPGAITGTREPLAHPSYRIVYQVIDETVSILSKTHTARHWPPSPDGDA